MSPTKKILVYSEAAPVHKDIVAVGMNRALTPLLLSIKQSVTSVIIYQLDKWHPIHHIDLKLSKLCRLLPKWTMYLVSVGRRAVFAQPVLDMIIAYYAAALVKNDKSDVLFSFVGADYGTLFRIGYIAKFANLNYGIYFVDDSFVSLDKAFLNTSYHVNKIERAIKIVQGATHVYTITEQLGKNIESICGVSSTVLNLPYEAITFKVDGSNLSLEIVYVGSINFLYRDSLLDLFDVVTELKGKTGRDIKIFLTTERSLAENELGELPSFVESMPIQSEELLAEKLAKSLFTFLAYSFDEKNTKMVSSSFPSKLLPYLAYAQNIVVYGPHYSSASELFQKNNLPTITISREQLTSAIESLIDIKTDNSRVYQNHLQANYSLEATSEKIMRTLFST